MLPVPSTRTKTGKATSEKEGRRWCAIDPTAILADRGNREEAKRRPADRGQETTRDGGALPTGITQNDINEYNVLRGEFDRLMDEMEEITDQIHWYDYTSGYITPRRREEHRLDERRAALQKELDQLNDEVDRVIARLKNYRHVDDYIENRDLYGILRPAADVLAEAIIEGDGNALALWGAALADATRTAYADKQMEGLFPSTRGGSRIPDDEMPF